jgi:ZIP family zinc transporter
MPTLRIKAPADAAAELPSSSPGSAFGDIPPTPERAFGAQSSARSFALALLASAATAAAVFRLRASAAAGAPTTVEDVWWAAWLTAAASVLGAAPFFCGSVRAGASEATLGLSNAAAAGMMCTASASLVWEALHKSSGGWDVVVGAGAGVLSVVAAKGVVALWGGADGIFSGLSKADSRRALLLCLVMFTHSATEGVGIGVSFKTETLGKFVSYSLALHNVPEGLATAIVLVPRGMAPLNAALWAFATSLSQPLLAVVAFSAVETFARLLPVGLGFAAGAMAYVSAAELLPEAVAALVDHGGATTAAAVTVVAAAAMAALQTFLK